MIVADTNLLAYLWLPGEHTSDAQRVLARDPEWCAPLLWRSEFRSVLAGEIRRRRMSTEVAVTAFDQASLTLDGREYAVAADAVLGLVRISSCSAYDCEFVALAQILGVPLVTADAKVLSEFPDIAVSMRGFG